MFKLFVYGSLKRGKSAFGFLERHQAVFLKEAVTAPKYHIYQISWFPGMVIDETEECPSGGVHGEVFEVSEECLKHLDQYEGAPDLFRREEITLEDGDKAITYIYVQPFSGKNKIESGIWDG
jgi:gamma-glutamylcyclotransferase (GGCT)/AIG2-like uncharacterized protein YtfP